MQAEPVKKTRKGSGEGDVRTPLYRQISDKLLSGIREGKFPVGTFLPGELELIDHFKASRHTIREAQVLEDMGLVKRQRGRGTLVLSTEASPPSFKWFVRHQSFSATPTAVNSGCFQMSVGGQNAGERAGLPDYDEWVQISGLRTPIRRYAHLLGQRVVVPEYGSIAQRLKGALARFTDDCRDI